MWADSSVSETVWNKNPNLARNSQRTTASMYYVYLHLHSTFIEVLVHVWKYLYTYTCMMYVHHKCISVNHRLSKFEWPLRYTYLWNEQIHSVQIDIVILKCLLGHISTCTYNVTIYFSFRSLSLSLYSSHFYAHHFV